MARKRWLIGLVGLGAALLLATSMGIGTPAARATTANQRYDVPAPPFCPTVAGIVCKVSERVGPIFWPCSIVFALVCYLDADSRSPSDLGPPPSKPPATPKPDGGTPDAASGSNGPPGSPGSSNPSLSSSDPTLWPADPPACSAGTVWDNFLEDCVEPDSDPEARASCVPGTVWSTVDQDCVDDPESCWSPNIDPDLYDEKCVLDWDNGDNGKGWDD